MAEKSSIAESVGVPAGFDPHRVRGDFPILSRTVADGRPLAYLDNAATTQKPRAVLDALQEYYSSYNSNVHRAIHELGQEATEAYEDARGVCAGFINAPESACVVFTRGTTESINLVAYAWGRASICEGDQIIATEMEHHSNLVPWQILAKEKGANLLTVPVLEDGTLDLVECADLFSRWERRGWKRPADALALSDLLRGIEQHDGHPRMDAPPEITSIDATADLSSETIGLHLELADLRRSQGDDAGAIEHLSRAAELHRKRGSFPGEARCLLAAATLGAPIEEPDRLREAVEGVRDEPLRIESLLILFDSTADLDVLARAFELAPPLPLIGHIGFRLASLQDDSTAEKTLSALRVVFEDAGDLRGIRMCDLKLGRPHH